jgi:DNA topoisomerase-3
VWVNRSTQSRCTEPPIIRKGASGSFYDKGLEGASHHAVIPNVNTVDDLREIWPRLSTDEKKLFDVIARAYLAAVMSDFRYRQTIATLDVCGFAFRATGRQPIDLGWRAAFPDWQPADEKADETQLLPALRNGEIARLENPTIEDKETRPPPRYNEGTLIEAMQKAWRFVNDEILERLKEAKGIGTPATRAEIIGGLKKQVFLTTQGKNIVPTEQAHVRRRSANCVGRNARSFNPQGIRPMAYRATKRRKRSGRSFAGRRR